MRAEIKVYDDDGVTVLASIDVPDARQDYRWFAETDETIPTRTGEYLQALDFRPFFAKKDMRDQALIESENSAGGHGELRARFSGGKIKHRAVTPSRGER